LGETLDEAPLIISPAGQLIHSLNSKGSPLSALLAALAGTDCMLGSRTELTRTRLVRAGLLASCRQEHLAELITDPRLELLWPHCLILQPKSGARFQLSFEQLRQGYQHYEQAVRKLIANRRRGVAPEYEPDRGVQANLYSFGKELRTFIDELPPWAKAFFGNIYALPHKLLWSFEVLVAPGECDAWCAPFAIEVTREVLHRQREQLIAWIDGAAQAEALRAEKVMLAKLADGPVQFRQLVRRYSNQRRANHEPILMKIVNAGWVNLRDDELLEISPAGRAQLIA
jgi:hypothetical protein